MSEWTLSFYGIVYRFLWNLKIYLSYRFCNTEFIEKKEKFRDVRSTFYIFSLNLLPEFEFDMKSMKFLTILNFEQHPS